MADGEREVDIGLEAARAIAADPPRAGALPVLLERIAGVVSGRDPVPDKRELACWLREVVPEFHHRETGKQLDDRM